MPGVLLVEDDQDTRETLAELLRFEGHDVISTSNGQDALEQLGRSGSVPCVILLDLMMPVMDGWEFCRQQQKDPRLARIPVVLLSGVDREAVRDLAQTVVGYFHKPINFEALLVTLSRHCQGAGGPRVPSTLSVDKSAM